CDTGVDDVPVDADTDARVIALVAMVRDHRAGLEVDVLTQDRVADEVEVREPCAVEEEGRFDLRVRPDHAILFEPDAATEIGPGADQAARPDDGRTLHDRAGLD